MDKKKSELYFSSSVKKFLTENETERPEMFRNLHVRLVL